MVFALRGGGRDLCAIGAVPNNGAADDFAASPVITLAVVFSCVVWLVIVW